MGAIASILLGFLFCFPAKAERWEKFGDEIITVRTGISQGFFDLNVQDAVGTGQEIRFGSNSSERIFLAGSWLGLSVAASAPVKIANSYTEKKGSTSADDYQLRLHFEKFSLDFFYQSFQGYYIKNSDSFSGTKSPGGYILTPDLRTEHLGFNFIWNFNSADFSMSAAFDQTERQTSSSWSWLGGVGLHSNRFSSPVTLVPSSESANYGEFGDVRLTRINTAMIGGGIGGSWVFARNSFLSGSGMIYTGVGRQRIDNAGSISESNAAPVTGALRLAVGYNGQEYLTALSFLGDTSTFKRIENADISFTTMSVLLIFGTHVDLFSFI